jgi:hypothetical protein
VDFAASHGPFADFFSHRLSDGHVRNMGRLAQSLSLGTPSLEVSPDGQWMLYAVIDHTKSDIKDPQRHFPRSTSLENPALSVPLLNLSLAWTHVRHRIFFYEGM